jgi:tetratricopeptide (TPR) repeat protein
MKRLGALLFLVSITACKVPSDTESPDDGALDRITSTGPSATDPADGTAAGPNAATDKKALPKVRDRDPEEEKKKMSLSRQRSAEGRKQLNAGRYSEAIDHSRQALKIHEQNVDAMLVIAEVYYKQKKFELVQAVTSSALSVDAKIRSPQETSRAHNLKGFAFVAMGDDNLATQSFRKAAEADEKNASAWNNLGTRYMQAGDVATAKQCFTYALELSPKLARAHLNLGAALRAEGKWTDAEKSLNAALKLKPNWAEAFFNLGVLYLDADPYPGLDTVGRLNKSIQFLTKYRELAVSDGPEGPGADPSAGIARAGAKGTAKIAPGPAAVSKARAEDYIRVAKKGIEREDRKAERERARGKDGGKPDPANAKPDAAKTDGAKPAKPSDASAPDDATAPGTTKPDATKPQAPGTAKPQAPSTPTSPPPAKPESKPPAKPEAKPPAKPEAKPEAPKTPPPTSPSPAPTKPQAPSSPTLKPQAPKPQAPKAPGAAPPATPKHSSNESARAWNPRKRVDTQVSGAMLDGGLPGAYGCDRECAPANRWHAPAVAISTDPHPSDGQTDPTCIEHRSTTQPTRGSTT